MKKSEATRLHILQKAYELIYLNGYQKTSIDDILATIPMTKGAFYYHFKNKDEMGLAIIKELLEPPFMARIHRIFAEQTDVLDGLYQMIANLLGDNDFLKYKQGCPLANFIQELLPKCPNFSVSLQELTRNWQDLIVTQLEDGKKEGVLPAELPSEEISYFIISGYWGIRNFGRMEGSSQAYSSFLKQLKYYLNTFKK